MFVKAVVRLRRDGTGPLVSETHGAPKFFSRSQSDDRPATCPQPSRI